MWFIYALITGIFFAINGLIIRYYAKKNKDSLITSFYFSFFSAVLLLPFFIYEFKVPLNLVFWGGILLIGVVLVVGNMFSFRAAQLLGASTQNTIGKIRLLFMVLAGVVLFNEVLTLKMVIGMILILAASILVIDYRNWHASKKGVLFIIIATMTSPIYAIVLKSIIGDSGVFTVTFLVCLFPAIINAAVIPNFIDRIKLKLSDFKVLILIAVVGVIANLSLIKALSYNSLAGIYFIIDASLVVILFGEHFVLKEKERLAWKTIAVVLAIAGAVLIQVA
jgi:drug/metabolite transporter (DMT)-like permease